MYRPRVRAASTRRFARMDKRDVVSHLNTYRTSHHSSMELAHPSIEGRRILARSGQARMRPLGHMGTGEGSPRIRTPERTGVPTDE
jgi:hypothetical protein